MDRNDEYRRNAAKAQQSARRARTDNERANWLRLAEGWLGLLRKSLQADEEAFDIKTAAKKRTGRSRGLALAILDCQARPLGFVRFQHLPRQSERNQFLCRCFIRSTTLRIDAARSGRASENGRASAKSFLWSTLDCR